MVSSSSSSLMDHRHSQLQQQTGGAGGLKPPPDQALKCPRCDSSNTKFCYYNNYSLSQPRHFCKTCKRYWTRGGTLRNVPVGGSSRKNKRIKRGGPSSSTTSSENQSSGNNNIGSQSVDPPTSSSPATDLACTLQGSVGSNHPIFYVLPSSAADVNLGFPTSSSLTSGSEFLHLPQFSSLSSYLQDHQVASFNPAHQVQEAPLSLLPDLSRFSSPLIEGPMDAPWKQQQQKLSLSLKDGHGHESLQFLFPFEEGSRRAESLRAGVKLEEDNASRLGQMDWQMPSANAFENGGNDPSPLYWNQSTTTSWPDISSYSSSVTPLI
ncbi:hypothetical protein AMTR_s00160p00046100 [Amborella trichopoda]|uniref:Dof zinc finger protein n=2 Tax=Amborella trichopoda TaxID=13333 RepID=W1PLS4_AMBTC|nr:hypothetical protein AMTR_s00160p00046100 [Amborella trichopoda]